MYKILIVEKDRDVSLKVQDIWTQCPSYQQLAVQSKEEALRLLEKEKVDLVFLDAKIITSTNTDTIEAEEALHSRVGIRHLPVFIFSDIACEREPVSVMCNIRKVFAGPVDTDTLRDLMQVVLQSHQLVKSLVEFHSCEYMALRMSSVLKTFAFDVKLDDRSQIIAGYALEVLSVVMCRNSLVKVLHFCKNMGLHPDVVNLLRNIHQPESFEEEIVHVIYEIVRSLDKHGNLDDTVLKSTHTLLIDATRTIIRENRILATCFADYEVAWENFLNVIMGEKQLDWEIVERYFQYIMQQVKVFIKEGLIDEKKMRMELLEHPHCYEKVFFLEVQNPEKAQSLVLPSPDADISACIDSSDGHLKLILSVQKQKHKTEDEQQRESLIYQETKRDVSAETYLKSFSKIDITGDLEDLEEIEEEWESHLLTYDESSIGKLHDIGLTILRYGRKIENVFYEFKATSYALTHLSHRMLEAQEESSPSKEALGKSIKLLELLKEDLANWREKVFIEKSAANVHYLDASLLVSCTRIEEILSGETLMEDSGMEFF